MNTTHLYNTHTRKTHVYKTPIQHANRKPSRKENTRLFWSGKVRHIYTERVRIKFILTHKTNEANVKSNRNTG